MNRAKSNNSAVSRVDGVNRLCTCEGYSYTSLIYRDVKAASKRNTACQSVPTVSSRKDVNIPGRDEYLVIKKKGVIFREVCGKDAQTTTRVEI